MNTMNTSAPVWLVTAETLIASKIKAGDFYPESWFREKFGIPDNGQSMTKDENDERDLFFMSQFQYLKKYFLMEHKLCLDRAREDDVSGFLVIHPKNHATCVTAKSLKRIKREMARTVFSIGHVDVDALTDQERQKSYDVTDRYERFVANARGDAKKFKTLGPAWSAGKVTAALMLKLQAPASGAEASNGAVDVNEEAVMS